jgi:hypothetical protein
MVVMAAMVMVTGRGIDRSSKQQRQGEYNKLLHGLIVPTTERSAISTFWQGSQKLPSHQISQRRWRRIELY